jgi:hypothetical protein
MGPTRVNTVPWWKGLPCLVIAPSSIEAHAWRQHLHPQNCAAPAVEPCVYETMPEGRIHSDAESGGSRPEFDNGNDLEEDPYLQDGTL